METSEKLITENLNVWTSAVKAKSSAGRGSSKKRELYGIARLRNLILELAVRGLLVPQDPNDEPALDLLKRISAEKARLVKSGEVRKQKPLPPPNNDETPFEIPSGWQWASLGALVYPEMGQSPPSKFYNQDGQGLPFFQGKADFGEKYPEPRYWCVQPSKLAYPNDVLLSVRAPVGPTNISNIECCIGRGLAALRPLCGVHSNFIDYLMKAFRSTLESFATGTTFSAVSKTNVETLAIAVPPLAEQHRIVAKVDELMALCDQLEQEQESSLDTHDTLVATLLGALTTATADASQFAEAWQRIQANFDTLFTTESSIDQLKQTILELAVMGKLVEQDAEDEPAATLLKRIAAEKDRLIKEKKIKKQKPLPKISAEEFPFEPPDGWVWSRMGDLTQYQKGYAFKSADYLEQGLMITKIRNLTDNHTGNSVYIGPERAEEFDQFVINTGDIVMTTVGSWFSAPISAVGRSFLINELFDNSLLNQNAVRIRAWSGMSSMYVHLCINSPAFKTYLVQEAQGTANQASITQLSIKSFLLCVPPKEEQHRIVAKVDELMALCDQLKASLATAQATQLNLADSLVEYYDF